MRVIDTGLKGAAENMAWDRALMEARAKDIIPDTIRFLRFRPCALVGYHQAVKEEIRVDYCRANRIEINRRITGGGAIYFDEGQLGWELIFKRSSLSSFRTMQDISTAICEAGAKALRDLGVNACFRPRNDIEVDGRKISGTGGTFENGVALFQGTLLVDFNLEHLIKALRIPVEKLSDKELKSAKERVVSLNDILEKPPEVEKIKESIAVNLANLFGKAPAYREVTMTERSLAKKYIKETTNEDWIESRGPVWENSEGLIHALSKSKGGLLRVSGRFDIPRKRLKQLLITGDVLISPVRMLYDIEAALKDVHVDNVLTTLKDFLESYSFEGVDVGPDDFIKAVSKLIEKFKNLEVGLEVDDLNAIETLDSSLTAIREKAKLVLVPYCAKSTDCDHRYTDSCDKCGECTVGEVYQMAEDAGMRVISINNYENLMEVLESEKKNGTRAYIGACCTAFFTKKYKAFVNAELPCAIVDINDTTCYELSEEDLAYKGEFKKQTSLKTGVMKKLLSLKSKTPASLKG